jgi:hypothetical protein
MDFTKVFIVVFHPEERTYIEDYLYCCTVHFEDSLSIAHQQMH